MKNISKDRNKKLNLSQVLMWMIEDGLVLESLVKNPDLIKQSRSKNHPLKILAELELKNERAPHKNLTLENLTLWLSTKTKVPYFKIDPLKVDVAKVTSVMTYAYAARFNILPVEVKANHITIATSEPFETEWAYELGRVHNKQFTIVIANPEDIKRFLVEFYSISKSVLGAVSQRSDQSAGNLQNLEQLMELGRAGKLDANDQHVVNIVDWLLQYAFEQRASDIHLEPRRDKSNVRFRIDGIMHHVYELPTPVMNAVSSRIKILGRMDLAEKRRPQDGRLKTRVPDGQEIEMRLSTMPTAFGEKLVMRIFDPEVLMRDFAELGFSKAENQKWKSLITQPHGVILVTGPTGSGKTTTLYSTLKMLAKPEVNVCTIEDPIEQVEPAFNQMQVHKKIELDFASGVRTLLRQDPDIIMIGEIRDLETAEMAVQAALTGHLVLSTLHTNDAPSAITRMLDIGIPAYLIHSSFLGIMAQRLVRTLCPECKQEAQTDDAQWQTLVKPWKIEKPKTVYSPVGCLECRNTGYRGRVGIYEMFTFSNDIKARINEETNIPELRSRAFKEGMLPLRICGAKKIEDGITTFEEVMRVCPPSLD